MLKNSGFGKRILRRTNTFLLTAAVAAATLGGGAVAAPVVTTSSVAAPVVAASSARWAPRAPALSTPVTVGWTKPARLKAGTGFIGAATPGGTAILTALTPANA